MKKSGFDANIHNALAEVLEKELLQHIPSEATKEDYDNPAFRNALAEALITEIKEDPHGLVSELITDTIFRAGDIIGNRYVLYKRIKK